MHSVEVDEFREEKAREGEVVQSFSVSGKRS